MLLNFMPLNILLSLPRRSWVKNAPAPLLAKCKNIVITNNIGHKKLRAQNAMQKSNMR